VVPHVEPEIRHLDVEARHALLDALADLTTDDASALRRRLLRMTPAPAKQTNAEESPEGVALRELRRLPPPRSDESALLSRERGEAHLALARAGSKLARTDLLHCLISIGAARSRLYCEAAGWIGDAAFVAPLARLAASQPAAAQAIGAIASREKITVRSKVIKDLDESLRPTVAKALAGN
jgi:hypothetical protein